MSNESELKKLAPADFIKQAEAAAETLTGYITYDPSKPSFILFGISPVLCPMYPISTDLIESIMQGQSHSCVGQQRQMWEARIALNATAESKKEGSLLNLLVSLAAAAKHSPCSCGGKSSARPRFRGSTAVIRRFGLQVRPMNLCWAVELIEPDGQSAGTFVNPNYDNVVDYGEGWDEGGEGRTY